MKRIGVIMIALLLMGVVAACGSKPAETATEASAETATETTAEQTGETTAADETKGPAETGVSLTEFELVENADKLAADMEAGNIPAECNVLYDEMGARPDVTVTDPEVIREIYEYLSEITVVGESQFGITDCYHHVRFTLQDGTVVKFNFEGTEILTFDRENYEVTGGGKLWSLVRDMQEEIMEEE